MEQAHFLRFLTVAELKKTRWYHYCYMKIAKSHLSKGIYVFHYSCFTRALQMQWGISENNARLFLSGHYRKVGRIKMPINIYLHLSNHKIFRNFKSCAHAKISTELHVYGI